MNQLAIDRTAPVVVRAPGRVARLSVEGATLLALVALGAALRFATLGGQSFDLDESVTVALLHHGLSGMLNAIPHTESTPPLYYLLAWAWTQLFGLNEVALRSLSALAGTAMIPLAYLAARSLASRRAGLFAAALTSVSPWLVWYSQEARAYSLFALLSLASFAAFVSAMVTPGRGRLARWAAIAALALASHYFAIFLVVPEAVWLLARREGRGRAGVAVGFVGAVGLALMPLALEQAHDIGSKAGFLRTPLASRIASIPSRLLLGEAPPSAAKVGLLSAGLVLAVAGVALLVRAANAAGGRLLWIGLSVGICAMVAPVVLALAGRDYLDARNLIGAWTPLVIVLAAGCAASARPGLLAAGGLGTLFLVVAVIGIADPGAQRTDYRGLARALGPSPAPGERAIVVSPDFNWTPLAYYLPRYPRLGSGDVGVREVDLVGWSTQRLSVKARANLERHGFKLAGARTLQRLRLVRFMAPDARSISGVQLRDSRLGDGSATVLIQTAR